MDAILIPAKRKKVDSPKKILVANLAHNGDVVIASGVVAALKKKYPEAEISALVGSWSLAVLEGNPYIQRIHTADHWKLNRSPLSLWKKLCHHGKTALVAIREIKREGYDWVIDLYPYFPNAIPLLWWTGIPCRTGYTSGGFGPLLTDPQEWRHQAQPLARYYEQLLDLQEGIKPFLVEEFVAIEPPFALIHMGTGAPHREWCLDKWKEVVLLFKEKNIPLFFTGKGERERGLISLIIEGTGYGVSLCDTLSWQQLVALVRRAFLIVSVETAIMHIASSFNTPNLIIAPALEPLWTPDNPLSCIVPSSSAADVVVEQIKKLLVTDLAPFFNLDLIPFIKNRPLSKF